MDTAEQIKSRQRLIEAIRLISLVLSLIVPGESDDSGGGKAAQNQCATTFEAGDFFDRFDRADEMA